MELLHFEKVKDGKYLKNYELTYLNKSGNEKKYEIVSRRDLKDADDLGGKPSGVSIVAICEDKMLLLHEFRMGINRTIYNLCAGMIESGETIEQCIKRELYEETGLKVKKIKKILPPSFAASSYPFLQWQRNQDHLPYDSKKVWPLSSVRRISPFYAYPGVPPLSHHQLLE